MASLVRPSLRGLGGVGDDEGEMGGGGGQRLPSDR